MKTEISKGTQKFIWYLVAFVAVFILALVIICRVLPESNRTATVAQATQITTTTADDNLSTDFDSVKDRVDQANNSTGKEIKELYTGEGKSTMQKQLEIRLLFSSLKSFLICVLLVLVAIVLIKKGFNIKNIRNLFGDDKTSSDTTSKITPQTEKPSDKTSLEDTPDALTDETKKDESDDSNDEPPIEEPVEPDEQEVAENCKL